MIKGQCWTCKSEAKFLAGEDKTPLCTKHFAMRVENDKNIKFAFPSKFEKAVAKAIGQVQSPGRVKRDSNNKQEVMNKETMRTVRVLFSNGDSITTSINGSDQEIRDYYRIGQVFNIGDGDRDLMSRVQDLEFIN